VTSSVQTTFFSKKFFACIGPRDKQQVFRRKKLLILQLLRRAIVFFGKGVWGKTGDLKPLFFPKIFLKNPSAFVCREKF